MKLDQYIQNNKHLFEEEPENGHFERFQQKANKASRTIVLIRWSTAVAASVLLLLSINVLWQYTRKSGDTMAVCESSADMQICYLNKMNDMAYQIDVLTKDFDPLDKQQVMDDVQNIIDATQSGFENEIPTELPQEAAKTILTDYYQHNLDGLNNIVKMLEEEQQE